jgi:hypothetical protein
MERGPEKTMHLLRKLLAINWPAINTKTRRFTIRRYSIVFDDACDNRRRDLLASEMGWTLSFI